MSRGAALREIDHQVRVRAFYLLLQQAHVLQPVPEYRFDLTRRWRLDFAWPHHRLALEVEGGVWTRGRHTRGAGFLRDVQKYNALAVQGWRLLRCTPSTLATPETVALIREALTPL